MTAEEYIYKHTYELDGIRNNLGRLGFCLVLSQNNALKAVEMAQTLIQLTCEMFIVNERHQNGFQN